MVFIFERLVDYFGLPRLPTTKSLLPTTPHIQAYFCSFTHKLPQVIHRFTDNTTYSVGYTQHDHTASVGLILLRMSNQSRDWMSPSNLPYHFALGRSVRFMPFFLSTATSPNFGHQPSCHSKLSSKLQWK